MDNKFIFTQTAVQDEETVAALDEIINALSKFGTVEPYVEPVTPSFTDEQYLLLRSTLDKETERADAAEQKLERYAPLMSGYDIMTAADKKHIEELTEENKAKSKAECVLNQFEQILEGLRNK